MGQKTTFVWDNVAQCGIPMHQGSLKELKKKQTFLFCPFAYNSLALSVSFHVVFTSSVWKMTQANFTQNFTRLVLHWFHPGIESFPVFIVAAFPLLSRMGRAFLHVCCMPFWPYLHCFLLGVPLTCVCIPVWLTWSNSLIVSGLSGWLLRDNNIEFIEVPCSAVRQPELCGLL